MYWNCGGDIIYPRTITPSYFALKRPLSLTLKKSYTMRNFPIVPSTNQSAQTAAQILANQSKPKTEKVAFKSSVDGTYKAYHMVNGEYIKWTERGFATKEEALASLDNN